MNATKSAFPVWNTHENTYFITQFPFIPTKDDHFLCNDHAHELHITSSISHDLHMALVSKRKLKGFFNLFQAYSRRVCKFYKCHRFENNLSLHTDQFFEDFENRSAYIRDYDARGEEISTNFQCNSDFFATFERQFVTRN